MKKLLFILVILLASFFRITAQRFPVVVVPQVNTPAPVNFYDYANGTTLNSPLSVQLLFNDITVSDRQIRLKVFFEGQGINFESRDVVVGASPLFISGGGPPLVLSNVELAPYFEFQNIQGINPNVYRESIPEGNYQFCFEVFEFNTGAKLSSKTCAPVFIFNNQPPLLNLPYNGINIKPDAVDNILFQWTPRHINVGNVSYKFSIVEIWDDRVDPQTSFLSVPPIFETTTSATSFLYGPSQPLLLPSKRYAWRVQAQALVGAEEVGLFKNEGKSEIFWFSRSEPCKTLLEVTAEPKGISKINVFWEEDPSVFTEYTIAYREAKRENSKWFTKTTNSAWATIWDLKPGTTYEYKVRAKCKYQIGEYSEIQEVTTNQKESDTDHYQCGITPDVISITNRDPHAGLSVGDRVVAGEFLVTITEIENQANGRITGKGFVPIPYLNKVRFGVTFSNILINTENQLAEGVITTFYDEKFGEGTSFDVDLDTDVTEIITGDTGVFKEESIAFEIKNVEINEDGAIEITGVDGETAIIKGDQNVVITDSEGTPWRVNKEDEVSKETAAEGGAVTANNTSGVTKEGEVEALSNTIEVNFVASGFYAFDQLPEGASAAMENEYSTVVNDKNEKETLAFKAIAKLKGEDIVKAKVDFKDSGLTKKDLIFKTSSGIAIPQIEWNDNETEVSLKLKNKSSYLNEQLLATVKKKGKEVFEIVGALNLTHLGNENVQNIKLSIVPINNANVNTNVKTKLNEIYNKVGVSFEVTITEAFQIPETIWNVENETASQLDIGDSSILKLYTPEENAIKDYFKSQFNYQKDHYYVFVTDLPTSAPDTNGFMPLKGQFGFVFTKNDRARTIAHELGHGIFGLTHPFASYNTPQGSTTLLMDYGKGELLNHMDWKRIHAPGFKLYNFQNDAAGESKKGQSDDEKMLAVLNHIKENLNKKSQDVLKWKTLTANRARGGNTKYGLQEKEYKVKIKNNKTLKFKLVSQPKAVDELQVTTVDNVVEFMQDAYFGLKKVSTFDDQKIDDISYRIKFNNEHKESAFTFEFGHYNDVEQFFQYLGYFSFYNTEIAKHIKQHLIGEFLINDIASKKKNCNDIDLFYAEAPSSLILESDLITNEILWQALDTLLDCFVDTRGVSEEHAIYTIIEALVSKDKLLFLSKIVDEKNREKSIFKLLYEKLDSKKEGEKFIEIIGNYIADLDTDANKWKITNAILKQTFPKGISLTIVHEFVKDKEAQKALTTIFTSLKSTSSVNNQIGVVSKLFSEMLIPDCNHLDDYKIIYEIAKERTENQEAFAKFTQSEKVYLNNGLSQSVGDRSWVLPSDFKLLGSSTVYNAEEVFNWAKKLSVNGVYDREELKKNKLLNAPYQNFFNEFLKEYKNFLKEFKKIQNNFWDNVDVNKINTQYQDIVDHINKKENARSLRYVNTDKKLAVLEKAITKPIRDKAIYKGIQNDALLKLAFSFRPKDDKIIKTIEKIGVANIYKELSGDKLNKFLFWIGEYVSEAKRTIPIKKEVFQDLVAENDLKNTSNSNVVKLEQNIFQLQNEEILPQKSNQNFLKVNGSLVDYKQEVLVYVVDDFNFLSYKFKKGQVLSMPSIKALALSNNNKVKVAKESAWLATDVISFGIGLGGAKILFTAGNQLSKAAFVSSTINSGIGIYAKAVNESEIDPETRSMLTLLGQVLSIPGYAKDIVDLKTFLTKTQTRVDEAVGLSVDARISINNYLNGIGLRINRDSFDQRIARLISTSENNVNIRNFRSWVINMDVNAATRNRLSLLNDDDLLVFARDFEFESLEIRTLFSQRPELIDAWDVLKTFRNTRRSINNIETLANISSRFEYAGRKGFEGLNALIAEGSDANKSNLIAGFEFANELIPAGAPKQYTLSGIKKGDVRFLVIKDGKKEEVARIAKGELKGNIRYILEGDIIGESKSANKKLLGKGNDLGFEIPNVQNTNLSAGDYIDNLVINNIRRGENPGVVVIGKTILKADELKGKYDKVMSKLDKLTPKKVETFNEVSQSSKTFEIEGKTYTWDELVKDYENKKKQSEALSESLLYKANLQWCKEMLAKGYTILDLGTASEGAFYELEKSIFF